MSWTTKEKLQLLDGETLAAESMAKALKIAIEKELVLEEPYRTECLRMIEAWFALREQRIKSNEVENPKHVLH